MKKKKLTIFSIKSKLIHLMIRSYVPKIKLLKIAKYSKKLQSLTDISIEDYKIHHLQFQQDDKEINLDDKTDEEKNKILEAIIDITQSYPLNHDYKEINTPVTLYSMIETTNNKIVASTDKSLIIIDNKTFDILKEIPVQCSEAIIHLIDLHDNIIAMGTFYKCIKMVNIETNEIVNEITASNPLLLSSDKFAFIWEAKIIRLTSKNASVAIGDIEISEVHREKVNLGNNDNSDGDFCVISSMIELENTNLLISSWNGALSEYDIKNYNCVRAIKLDIEYIDFLYELNDGRIAFCVNDNGYIYIYNKYEDNNNLLILKGHTNSVIQIMQLNKKQLISASYDGKIKIWILDEENESNFKCSLTLNFFKDYIRKFILLRDGRICATSDEKCIRALGVMDNIDNFSIKYIGKKEENNYKKNIHIHPNSFEFTDIRFN